MEKIKGFVLYDGPSLLDGATSIVMIMTLGSENRKTGDMVQTWILRKDASPTDAVRDGSDSSICGDCPHRGPFATRTCYVTVFQAPRSVWAAYQRGLYKYAPSDSEVAAATAGRMVRLGAYGDPAAVPASVLRQAVHGAKGWTGYTHAWRQGFAIADLCMASCETETDVAQAAAFGFRAFVTTPGPLPRRPGHMVCPASDEGGHRLTCAECGACGGVRDKGARAHVQIALHGQGAKRASLRVVA